MCTKTVYLKKIINLYSLGPDQVTIAKRMMEKIQTIMRCHLVSRYCRVKIFQVEGWLIINHQATTPSIRVAGPKKKLVLNI